MLGDWIDDLISFGKDYYSKNQGELDGKILRQKFPQLSDDNLVNQALGTIDMTVKAGRSKGEALGVFQDLPKVPTTPTIKTADPDDPYQEFFKRRREIGGRKKAGQDVTADEETLKSMQATLAIDDEDIKMADSLPSGASYNFKQLFDERKSGNSAALADLMSNYRWQGALVSGMREKRLDGTMSKEDYNARLQDINRFLNIGAEGVKADKVNTDIAGWKEAHGRFADYLRSYTDGSEMDSLNEAMLAGYAERYDKSKYNPAGKTNEYQEIGLQYLEATDGQKFRQTQEILKYVEAGTGNYDQQLGLQKVMRDLENIGLKAESSNLNLKLSRIRAKEKDGTLTPEDMMEYEKLYARRLEVDDDIERQKFRYPSLSLLETRSLLSDYTGEAQEGLAKRLVYLFQTSAENIGEGFGGLFNSLFDDDQELAQDNTEAIGRRVYNQRYRAAASNDVLNNTRIELSPELQAKVDNVKSLGLPKDQENERLLNLFLQYPSQVERKAADSRLNLGGAAIAESVLTYGTQLFGVIASGFGGRAASVGSMFMNQLGDSYVSNIEDGKARPLERAMLTATLSSLSEGIVDNGAVLMKMMGSGKFNKVFSDETFKLLSNADRSRLGNAWSRFKTAAADQGIGVVKNTAEEIIQGAAINMSEGDDVMSTIVDDSVGAALGQVAFATIGAIANFRSSGRMTREILYRSGLNPDAANLTIDQQLSEGKITAAEAEKRKEIVKEMSSIVEKVEAIRVDGSDRETRAAIDHAFNLFVRGRVGKIEVPASMKEQYDQIVADLDAEIGAYNTGDQDPVTLDTLNGVDIAADNIDQVRQVLNAGGLQEHERQVLADVALASKVLEGTGVRFKVFNDADAFVESYESTTGVPAEQSIPAVFDGNSGTVFINLSAVGNDVNWNAAWHESTHPILNIIKNTDPDKYNALLDGLASVKGFESEQSQRFGRRNYSGEVTQKDEALTEFLGNVRKGYIDLDNIEPSFKQKMVDVFNKAMEVAGIDYRIEDTKGKKFIDAALEISSVLSGRKTLADLVGDNNLKTIQREAQFRREDDDLVEQSGMRKQMTEDDKGNYVFYHYSGKDLRRSGIDPEKFGSNTNATGRDERPMKNISMYYTRPDVLESGIPSKYGHVVRIPKDKVYPFNSDPLNLLPAAEKEFRKNNPELAFDANKQLAFVADEAAKRGYPMTVAKWGNKLRAQSTQKLKPELYQEERAFNQIVTNPKLDFKPNAKRRELQYKKSGLTRAEVAGEGIKKIGKKGDWAIITATREDRGEFSTPKNRAANRRLFSELKDKYGAENVIKLQGFYKGNPQGDSFMVLNVSEQDAKDLGVKYGQESVLTKRGNVFSDGTGFNRSSGKVIVGDKAKKQDGYSITEDGTAFSLDIDWANKETGINDAAVAEAVKSNPNFIENAKAFANESSFANKLEFKRALQDRMKEAIKSLKSVYGDDFDPSQMTWKTMQYVKDVLTQEARIAIEAHPEAIGWYDEKTRNALSIMALVHPAIETDVEHRAAFITALAITSNGNKVDKNFEYAEQEYINWVNTGRFNESGKFGAQQKGVQKSFALVNRLLDKVGVDGMAKFFLDKHRAGDLTYKAGTKKTDLATGELADTEVFGATVLGSKIGNGFFMNLWGEFEQLTMDRWFMRTWGRVTGTLIDTSPEKIDKAKGRYVSAMDAVKADPEAAKVLKGLGLSLGRSVDGATLALQKASADTAKRESMSSNDLTDELRRAANAYQRAVTGEVEAPANGGDRNFIRETFAGIQENLKLDGIDISMADLQAVLWYPEKILYESFKADESFEQAASGYTSGEAPDYQNAAAKLAKSKGVTDDQINQALGGRGRNTRSSYEGYRSDSRADSEANRRRALAAISGQQFRRADIDAAIAIADEDGQSILDLPTTGKYIRIEKAPSGYMVNAFSGEDEIVSDQSPILSKKEAYKRIKNLSWMHGMQQFRKAFYSPIEKRVEEFKQPKASVQKWKDIVGIKSDEAVFSGLSDWLNSMRPDQQVSKEEILDFMEKNAVQIEEVVKGQLGERKFGLFNKYGALEGAFESEEDAKAAAEVYGDSYTVDSIEQRLGYDPYPDTKYSGYTVGGPKSNYQETLITMPSKNDVRVGDVWMSQSGVWYAEINGRDVKVSEEGSMVSKQEVREMAQRMTVDSGSEFKSGHWDEKNVLAHIRTNRRVDADGNNVLFLEEVQSDWGQKGRKEGFGLSDNDIKRLKELGYDYKDGKVGVIAGDGFYQRYYNDLSGEAASIARKAQLGVSPAPFVTNTNAWVKLGLKYALKKAVDQGADVLAWTTGDQQNQRYDLRKQVDEIGYSYSPKDNTYRVIAGKGPDILFNRVLGENQLEGVVGKELADKIVSGKDSAVGVMKFLRGQDLKIGGKGMNSFYGDAENEGIVGRVAKALVKELTGENAEMDGVMLEGAGSVSGVEGYGKDGRGFYAKIAGGEKSYFANRGEFVSWAREASLPIQPAIRITDKLRESVKNGMPQFRKLAPNGRPSNLTDSQWEQVRTPEFKAWFGDWENDPENASKVVDENGEPRVMYHGTTGSFDVFRGWRGSSGHFAFDEKFASGFAESREMDEQDAENDPMLRQYASVFPVFINARNIFDIRDNKIGLDPEYTPVWETLEYNSELIYSKGFDAYFDFEKGKATGSNPTGIAVNNPRQIKSATGNSGSFNPNDNRIQFRRSDISYGTRVTLSDLRINTDDTPRSMVNKLRAYNGGLNPVLDFISSLPELNSARIIWSDEVDTFGYVSEKNAREAGMPDWARAIVIPEAGGPPNAYYSLTHELLHFVTLDGENVRKYGNQKKLDEIRKIYNKFKSMGKEFDGVHFRTYGMESEAEFFVEAVLNPSFREYLNEEVEKGFADKILDFIKDMLKTMGISVGADDNMVAKVIELAEDVFFDNKFSVASIDEGDTIYGNIKATDKMVPAGAQLRISAYQRNRTKEAFDKLTKARGTMPQEVYDAQVGMHRAIAGHIAQIDMLSAALRKAAKKIWKTGPFNKNLNKQAAEVINEALSDYSKIDQLPDGVREIVRDMRNSIDAMSEQLLKLGIAEGSLAAVVDANMGTYLNRTYRKYHDADWAKHVSQDIIDKAAEYIRNNETRDDGQGGRRRLTDDEIAGEINKIITGQGANIVGGSKVGSKDISNLKTRKIYDYEVDTIIATPVAGGYKIEGWLGLDKIVERIVAPDLLEKAVGSEVAGRIKNAGQMFGGQYQGTANNKWIVIKDEIPEPIRELMGEYKDPLVNYANTAIKLAQLVEKQKFLNQIRTELEGKYFFSEPTGEFFVPVTSAGSDTMDPLNEVRYTTPEIADAFQKAIGMQGDDINSDMIRVWMYMNGLTKLGKTVLSPTSQVRNIIGGVLMNMANFRSPLSSNAVRGFMTAWNIVSNGKVDDAAFRAHVQELTSLGILDESPDLAVIRDIMDRLNRGESMMSRYANASNIDRFISNNKMVDLYKATDNWNRIWAFHQEYRTLRRFKPDMSEAEAKKTAADIVRRTYPTYSMAPAWVRSLARNIAVSSFPTFAAESIRTATGTFQQAISEMKDPDLRPIGVGRFASMITVMSLPAVMMAASKALNKYDDEDEKDVVNMSPDFLKDNSKFYLPRNKSGHPSFIDISASHPYSLLHKPVAGALRVGSDKGLPSGVGEFIGEALSPFASPEILTGKVIEGIQDIDPATDSPRDMAIKMGSKVKEALEPAGITAGRKIVYGLMGEPLDGKMYDPKREAIAMATGQRYYDIDPVRSQFFAAAAFNRFRQAKAKEYYDPVKKKASAADIDREYKESLAEITEKYEELRAMTQSAMRQMKKMPEYNGNTSQIRLALIKQMKELRVNEAVRNAVINNKPFPPKAFERKKEDPNE